MNRLLVLLVFLTVSFAIFSTFFSTFALGQTERIKDAGE
jgi:hypothetical protein